MIDFPANMGIEALLAPAADAGGRTGTIYRDVGDCTQVWMMAYINQGNAATVQLDPKQASDSSGTGTKALSLNASIYHNQDMDTNTWTKAADAKTFTTSAATKAKCVIFKFTSEALDIANGFRFVQITTGASNAANITSAFLIKMYRYSK